jgi:hypothetical protein
MTNVKPSMANATAPGSGISVRTPSTSQPAIRNARPAWKTSREPICFARGRPVRTGQCRPRLQATRWSRARPLRRLRLRRAAPVTLGSTQKDTFGTVRLVG